MGTNIYTELLHNIALLLALSVIYEIRFLIPNRWKKFIPVFNGVFIGLIGLAIMSIPFEFSSGIIFDTRSILISATALSYGAIPTIIAAVIMIDFRSLLGGVGVWAGMAVILATTIIGLLWRYKFFKSYPRHQVLNIYIYGVIIHIGMLMCMFIMPFPIALKAVKEMGVPIMVLYPIVTVLLCRLLLHQKERSEALLKLSESEARYKSFFYNNHAVMLLINPDDGRLIDVNPAACRFYGWTLSEMKEMYITQINTLTPQETKAEMEQAATEHRNHFIFKHRRANETIVDVEVYSGPITQNGKKFIYSIVHDISERVAAERALIESENRFKLLVENAPDAIFIVVGLKFYFLNPSAIKMFGAHNEQELIGTSVMDRFHPDYHDIIRQRMIILNDNKTLAPPSEEVYLKMDGTPIQVDVTAMPINYNNIDGDLVFARDITKRKKAERAKDALLLGLRQQQKLEAIGTLAGGVAHEINNPINGIMNYAQLVLDTIDQSSEQGKYLKEIIHETERVSVIVKNLLQFSRHEKQSYSYASVYDIVNQTASLINSLVIKDQIKLDIQLDEGLPDIMCRSQQIQQVLMNLLTNARDALNEKYPGSDENKIIRVRCSQYTSDERRWVQISVEDYGNGIPKEALEKIYDPFFSTKPKEKGTGLGLSISFGIIKDHHGKISVETKEGRGAKFIVDLLVDNRWAL